MMTRLWYPVDLIDEYTPPGRATPEAWLSPEFPGIRDYEQHIIDERYGPGDTIAFKWCERHPDATLSINQDGTLATPRRCPETPDMFTGQYSPEMPPPAAEANFFYNDDFEIFAASAEEFARLYAAEATWEADHSADPLIVEAECAHWSDVLIFTINADGKSLTPVEAKEADS